MPRASINERILIFLYIIDLLQLFFITPQSETTAAQRAANGQAKENFPVLQKKRLKNLFCF